MIAIEIPRLQRLVTLRVDAETAKCTDAKGHQA